MKTLAAIVVLLLAFDHDAIIGMSTNSTGIKGDSMWLWFNDDDTCFVSIEWLQPDDIQSIVVNWKSYRFEVDYYEPVTFEKPVSEF